MYFRKRADPIQLPKPYVVSPSGSFDGDDGKWSTFSINVGDYDYKGHGQNFRVLISTSSPITLVPGTSEWCNEDCAKNRGVQLFNRDQPLGLVEDSSSWKSSGLYNIPLPYWWSSDLSRNTSGVPTGDWGSANLGLGESSAQSPVLDDQWIVSYTIQDFFLGSLGLAIGDVGASGATKPTFLTNLYGSQNFIPSRSYGYTAGAYYRNNEKGVLGNLVLGGYDKSRTTQGTVIGMPSQKNNTLAVGVASILYEPNQNVEANKFSFTSDLGVFMATIDSTLPYLILPSTICDQFKDRFRLQYDANQKLYTVNATAHSWNIQQNATVKFKIVDGPQDNDVFTTISLPYAAFVQSASYPIYGNSTQYFPIKKSTNGLYVLGRTFLQETYITVDYERARFNVSPAYFANPMPSPDVVPIFNLTYNGIPHQANSNSGLPAGAIAGIVVGIVLAFIIAGAGGFIWWKKRENKKKRVLQQYEKPAMDIDTVAAGNEVKYRRVSELTGSETVYSSKTPTTGGYYNNDHKPIPPISEMSPESTPAELYSPPPESASDRDSQDYFTPAGVRRRGATRSRASSALNTPGTPIAELPGDEGVHVAASQDAGAVSPLYSPMHSRGPSDTSLSTNIDEVLAGRQDTEPEPEANAQDSHSAARPSETTIPEEQAPPTENTDADQQSSALGRRPSHGRGLSDSTIHSDSTAVSQPTPEELERWARSVDDGPNRPLSQ